ncbi:hypothetical protein DYBT9623_01121 [Dyadobacter sp. CECT 9623]|uniref:Uncharacterized protein n=1 Tax=Dyadobacter linearis TaxID=2823330 RepID=A0ABM8ULW1_9BACT|nr:hypothetical protein [Dyadobacter sp. CECT 9623]CAG5068391.1 hypothetical protein DYBT9623_01121 [Dyadobacter sp. CECT 9623]
MENGDVKIINKKPIYPVSPELRKYLRFYQRDARLPVSYHDLLGFYESFPVTDKFGKDTLWESPLYPSHEIDRLHNGLKKVYAMLKASGNLRIVEHKYIDRIDYCKFGNSNPFRIKIVNRLNDIYDYFYVKKADASRIYGLELEEIFSPNQVNYLVDGESLIEEHIAGIPGDEFAKTRLRHTDYNPIRIAKEFVKFNERCTITLLGDMRAYNFVMQITPDFDDFQFRLRAIDFDQQFYEGNLKVYMPQFFKENLPYVELAMEYLTDKTVLQYQQEEQSSIMYQARSERHRLRELRDVSIKDNISTVENISQLREGLSRHFKDTHYRHCESMTEIIELNIKNIIRQVIS